MSNAYFDLVAQRAASVARIADMTRRIPNCTGDERALWESMLASYIKAMPNLDAQIARAKVAA